MKIQKAALPHPSALQAPPTPFNYVDSFQAEIHDPDDRIDTFAVAKAFFSGGPKWISALFGLRNKIVALFGLKTSGGKGTREEALQNVRFEPGDQVGLFKVFARNAQEVILGEDDKHLDFRVSLFLQALPDDPSRKTVTVSTTVKFNNWFGRLYFFPVRPFHKRIVPSMLRNMVKELQRASTQSA